MFAYEYSMLCTALSITAVKISSNRRMSSVIMLTISVYVHHLQRIRLRQLAETFLIVQAVDEVFRLQLERSHCRHIDVYSK